MASGTLLIEIGANLARLQNDLGKMERMVSRSAGQISRAFSSVGVGLGALGLFQLAQSAAETAEAMDALGGLTAQYGITARDMVSTIQDASNGLISMRSAAASANEALMKGFTPAQLKSMAEWSETISDMSAGTKKTADILAQLIETMATGRERGVVKLLGSTIDLKEAYGKYAEVMSKAEKQQAIFTLAAERMAAVQKTLGDRIDSTADKMERFLTQIEDLKKTVGDLIIRLGTGLLATFQSVATVALDLASVIMVPIVWLMRATDFLGVTQGKAEEYKVAMEALGDAAVYTAEQAAANFNILKKGFAEQSKRGGAILPAAELGGSKKALDELEALYKKYISEKDAAATWEGDRDLVRLNLWYDENVKKLDDLHAAKKYHDALYAAYSVKWDLEKAERDRKLYNAEAESANKMIDLAERRAKAYVAADESAQQFMRQGEFDQQVLSLKKLDDALWGYTKTQSDALEQGAIGFDTYNDRIKEAIKLTNELKDIAAAQFDREKMAEALGGDYGKKMLESQAGAAGAEFYKQAWLDANQSIWESMQNLYSGMSSWISSSLQGLITGTMGVMDALKNLGSMMLGIITQYVAKWLISRLFMAAMGKTFQSAEIAAAVVTGTAVALAWAPAAAFVEIATLGSASIAAAAGLAATVGLAESLALFGGAAHGGLDFVPAESTFLLDRGERVLSPRQNEDLTDFLGGKSGGGEPMQINLHIDGERLATWIHRASRQGRLNLVPT